MATIKSFTSLEQSRKLAEILLIESADFGWNIFVDSTSRILPINDWDLVKDGSNGVKFFHAWSLAALLKIIGHYILQTVSNDKKVFILSEENYPICSDNYSEPVDACYEMILKLHGLNLL